MKNKNLSEMVQFLSKVILDGGTFQSVSPSDAYMALTSDDFEPARQKLIQENTTAFDSNTYDDLISCALDALDAC